MIFIWTQAGGGRSVVLRSLYLYDLVLKMSRKIPGLNIESNLPGKIIHEGGVN
jgi:hypothetical protein